MFCGKISTTFLSLMTIVPSYFAGSEAEFLSPPWPLPPDPSADHNEDDQVLDTFKLNFVKEKILRGLGLVAPPKFNRKSATILKQDTGWLPLPPHSVHSPVVNAQNKYSRVVVFADSGSPIPCIDSRSRTSNGYSAVSFKVPRAPFIIRKAVLWYKTLENGFETSESKSWICSCKMAGSINSTADKADGCLPLQTISRKSGMGWNSVRLNQNWKSLVSDRIARHEQRILFLNLRPLQITNYKRPFIAFEVGNEIPQRLKRAVTSPRDCGTSTDRCCRSTFWVNVTQLGWNDWIIDPSGFYFHYCTGRCQKGFDRSETGVLLDYAIVLNAHIARHPTFRAKPCCVPKKMSRLPIVLTTNRLAINRTYIPQFIVNECTCMGFSYET